MKETFKATLCDDGAWMIHDDGDVIAFADIHDAEAKARRVAAALNAMTTFVPENGFDVKPGYCTRPDIARLLRLHRRNPLAVQFIADMME